MRREWQRKKRKEEERRTEDGSRGTGGGGDGGRIWKDRRGKQRAGSQGPLRLPLPGN